MAVQLGENVFACRMIGFLSYSFSSRIFGQSLASHSKASPSTLSSCRSVLDIADKHAWSSLDASLGIGDRVDSPADIFCINQQYLYLILRQRPQVHKSTIESLVACVRKAGTIRDEFIGIV